MPIFRKKPVTVEAFKWDGSIQCADHLEDWSGGKTAAEMDMDCNIVLTVSTLEGALKATIGDWIIKGVKGEFYPIKPDIFASTYDAAE